MSILLFLRGVTPVVPAGMRPCLLQTANDIAVRNFAKIYLFQTLAHALNSPHKLILQKRLWKSVKEVTEFVVVAGYATVCNICIGVCNAGR